jgi:hypothetical protein
MTYGAQEKMADAQGDPPHDRPRILRSAANLMRTWGRDFVFKKGAVNAPGHEKENMIYDREADTRLHIDRVRFLLSKCAINLLERGLQHDAMTLIETEPLVLI